MSFTLLSRLYVSIGATLMTLVYHNSNSLNGFVNNLGSSSIEPIEIEGLSSTDNYTHHAMNDFINSLPGLKIQTFRQFSGYLILDKAKNKHVHYWYVESQRDPQNDPVVFWTNGGPACSGLVGLGTEHGPFFYSKTGELELNPYSWNHAANMLYIEQPVGVGFSYSKNPEKDYITGDAKAASDNYRVITEFFKRFPERQSNRFYIASESYGGHYMPQLAMKILKMNDDKKINFQGFLVGNPFVDPITNMITRFQAYYSHGLVAKPIFDQFLLHCTIADFFDPKACSMVQVEIYKEFGTGINPYALDYPVCTEGQEKAEKGLHSTSSQAHKLLKAGEDSPGFLPPADKYNPCEELHFTKYINRADVKEALHVRSDITWAACTDDLHYAHHDYSASQVDLYREIIAMGVQGYHDLDILVFSGDDDAICSLAGTQAWIFDIGVVPKSNHLWKAWKLQDQTAGYVTHFDMGSSNASFTFATVHGAGHEVPTYRPKEAFVLFDSYLHGTF